MCADMDVRHVLPVISAPTLALVRAEDENAAATRYLAAHIKGARYVELPGRAHLMFLSADQDEIVAEVEEFLTGVRPRPEPDRVLATILFTDIVGSTSKAAELGDRSWRNLVERHHALVRSSLERFGGTEIDTAGAGFFASFDGPARAIRCAGAVIDAVRELGLEVRAGLHTGECEPDLRTGADRLMRLLKKPTEPAKAVEAICVEEYRTGVVGILVKRGERRPINDPIV
jgi:hypothetical protein